MDYSSSTGLISDYPQYEIAGGKLPLIEMYFGKGALTDEQKAELSRKVTDLIVKEAKQPQQYTWVIIHEVPAENWMVDRLTLPELRVKLMEKKSKG